MSEENREKFYFEIDPSGVQPGQAIIARTLADIRKSAEDTAAKMGKSSRQQETDAARLAGQTAAHAKKQEEAYQKVATSIGGVVRMVQVLGGLVGLGWSLSSIIGTADAYKLLDARLKLVTKSEEERVALNHRLFEVANETRQSVEGVASLYSRVARNATQLGASQEQVVRMTKAVSQSMLISGASTMEAQSAILQLGQAMASGVLRGDELRSVMENAPRLAEAISKGMGVTIGELRKMGAEGKLTAKQVMDAILAQEKVIEAEAKKIPMTVGQALTVVQNKFMQYVGRADEASSTTAKLARGIAAVGNNLTTLIPLVLGLTGTATAMKLVAAGWQTMTMGVVGWTAAIKAATAASLAFLATPLGMTLAAVAVAGAAVTAAWVSMKRRAAEARAEHERLNAAMKKLGEGLSKAEIQAKIEQTMWKLERLNEMVAAGHGDRQALTTQIMDLSREYARWNQVLAETPDATKKGKGKTFSDDEIEDAKKKMKELRDAAQEALFALMNRPAWEAAQRETKNLGAEFAEAAKKVKGGGAALAEFLALRKQIEVATKANAVSEKLDADAIRVATFERQAGVKELREELAARREGGAAFVLWQTQAKIEAEVRKATAGLTGAEAEAVARLTRELVIERELKRDLARLGPAAVLPRANVPAGPMRVPEESEADFRARLRRYEQRRQQIQSEIAQSVELAENFIRGVQDAMASFFAGVMEDGVKSFRDLFTTVKRLFIDLLAQMAAAWATAPIARSLAGMMGMQFDENGGLSPTGAGPTRAGQMVGSAGAGALLGYGIGYGSGNRLTGALGGAAAGALAGAKIGGAPGAIVGGLVGAAAGLFGAAQKAQEAAALMRKARQEFAQAMDDFVASAGAPRTGLQAAMEANRRQGELLKEQAIKLYGGNSTRLREEFRKIEAAGEANKAALVKSWQESVEAAINSLQGNEALNRRAEIEKQYAENLANAAMAGVDSARATELYRLQLEALEKAEARAAVERARRAVDIAQDIGIREARLRGDDRAAVALELDQQRTREVARYQDMLAAGELTEEQFQRLVDLLNREAIAALQEYDDAIREAAEAAAEAAEAERERMQEQIDATRAGLLGERLAYLAELGVATQQQLEDYELEIRQRERVRRAAESGLEALAEEVNALELAALARRREMELAEEAARRAADRAAHMDDLLGEWHQLAAELGLISQGTLETYEMELRQRERLERARGLGLEELAEEINALEREALAKRRLREEAERAMRLADRQLALQERLLRAQGDDRGADLFGFMEQQRKELRDAVEEYGADSDFVRSLRDVLDAERRRFEQELAERYAEPVAPVDSDGRAPGASNVSSIGGPAGDVAPRLAINLNFYGDISTTDVDEFTNKIVAAIEPEMDRLLGTRVNAERRRNGSVIA